MAKRVDMMHEAEDMRCPPVQSFHSITIICLCAETVRRECIRNGLCHKYPIYR